MFHAVTAASRSGAVTHRTTTGTWTTGCSGAVLPPRPRARGLCVNECAGCGKRIIALIDDPPVVRRILEHLGLWQPEASERSPPVPSEA